MKWRDLIKELEYNGWKLIRRGGNHDIYSNGKEEQPIPRHSEINEFTARGILKKAGLK